MTLADELEKPKRSEEVPAPAAETAVQPRSAYADPAAVIVIPRVAVNYVIIAVVFFTLGAVISGAAISALFNANSKENQALITAALDARGDTAAAQQPRLQTGQRYDVSADDDAFLGDANAPITIVEFSDYKCPYCGRFERETLHPILNDFAGKVRLVYRDYPILGQGSVLASLAAECAKDQGKFWEFHDLLFANQQDLTRDAFLKYSTQLGLNQETFTTCFDQQQKMTEITKDASDAQNLGVTGTPAFFINGQFISGAQPYAVFASAINAELGRLEESTPEPVASS